MYWNKEFLQQVGKKKKTIKIRRMRFACWIIKNKDTHSEYEIIIAFPRQRLLRERAWMLR